ncbi:MAG: PH domain-containing protein [Parcubacteria group bacterium]
MHFPGQKPGEQVIVLIRRHWLVLVRQIFFLCIAAVIPLAAYLLLSRYTEILLDRTSVGYVLIVMGASVYALCIVLFLFISWIDYYLDVWVVTKDRIIAIEQKGLFSRTVAELSLDRVQDVTSDVHGFVATMMRYGNIRIQTAGEQSQFVFEQVPHPYETARKIMEMHAQYVPQNSPAQSPPAVPPQQSAPTPKGGTPTS